MAQWEATKSARREIEGGRRRMPKDDADVGSSGATLEDVPEIGVEMSACLDAWASDRKAYQTQNQSRGPYLKHAHTYPNGDVLNKTRTNTHTHTH